MTRRTRRTPRRWAASFLLLTLPAIGSPLVGCHSEPRPVAPVHHAPTMVRVSPRLWVIEDYDEPVYFYSGYYWYPRGGLWYRSERWDGDFHPYPHERVPEHLRDLHHDEYRHYHGPAGAERSHPAAGEHPHERRSHHPDRDRHAEPHWGEEHHHKHGGGYHH